MNQVTTIQGQGAGGVAEGVAVLFSVTEVPTPTSDREDPVSVTVTVNPVSVKGVTEVQTLVVRDLKEGNLQVGTFQTL